MARKRPDFTRDFAAPPSAYRDEPTEAPFRKRMPRRRKRDLVALAEQAYRREDGAIMIPVGEGRCVNSAFLRRAGREDAT
ncbi:hypothetical protein [Kaistia sp. MMO-174]|uniref:hypothetical protein n=1 Tax=Kaistia sp. MMO-174 TaxID=3081256 RepID=UPI0030159F14